MKSAVIVGGSSWSSLPRPRYVRRRGASFSKRNPARAKRELAKRGERATDRDQTRRTSFLSRRTLASIPVIVRARVMNQSPRKKKPPSFASDLRNLRKLCGVSANADSGLFPALLRRRRVFPRDGDARREAHGMVPPRENDPWGVVYSSNPPDRSPIRRATRQRGLSRNEIHEQRCRGYACTPQSPKRQPRAPTRNPDRRHPARPRPSCRFPRVV